MYAKNDMHCVLSSHVNVISKCIVCGFIKLLKSSSKKFFNSPNDKIFYRAQIC